MLSDESGSDFCFSPNKRLARIFALSDKNGETNKDETNPNKKSYPWLFTSFILAKLLKQSLITKIADLKHKVHVCYDQYLGELPNTSKQLLF